MDAPAIGAGEFPPLAPLFGAAAVHRHGDQVILLPAPAARSSLAADDEPLKSWGAADYVRSSFSAGLVHVEVLRTMVVDVRKLDAFSPWTLLRAATENLATTVWLLEGATRQERQHRVLRLWAEDFRNRAQYEADTHHIPTSPAKTGTEPRLEVEQLASSLGLRPLNERPLAGEIISSAARAAGLDPLDARASWRVASGFAHGRRWPPLRAAKPTEVVMTPGGRLVGFVIDDAKLATLATVCRAFLEHAAQRYRTRSVSP